MLDDNRFQKIIRTKCNLCYRKDARVDGCLLFKDKHAGIENCLRPFENHEDRQKKIKEDFYKYKKKVKIERAIRDAIMNKYLRNKKLFDD